MKILVSDSLSKQGVEILQKAGLNVTIRPLGLTSGSAAKASAFEQAGIPHYENWEQLMAELEI